MASLANLSDQDLRSEVDLAADLMLRAPHLQAQAEAYQILLELTNELSRREEIALQEAA
jgi:hypothetical protein